VPLVTFDNVAKSFGSRRLFAGVSFALDARDHAVLVSTAILEIDGVLQARDGLTVRAQSVRPAPVEKMG